MSAFNWDKCCHLEFFLEIILFYCIDVIWHNTFWGKIVVLVNIYYLLAKSKTCLLLIGIGAVI